MLFQFQSNGSSKPGFSFTNLLIKNLLRLMALNFNLRPGLNQYLKSVDGWMNFSANLRTENNSLNASIVFKDGKAFVPAVAPDPCDISLIFRDDKTVRKLLGSTPTEQIFMLLKSELRTQGNQTYLNLLFFYLNLLLKKKAYKLIEKEKQASAKQAKELVPDSKPELSHALLDRKNHRLKGPKVDPGVRFLDDPYLSQYSLEDFPRLSRFLDIHFTQKGEICPERPKILTDWFKEHGFEKDASGKDWIPELRQGLAFKHLMENRKPIIRKDDLLAGTSTTKEVGVIVYPDAHGTMLWGELYTVPHRSLNPYDVSEDTVRLLHHEVFPYFTHRNFKEWVRYNYQSPLCQAIDERYAVYFVWKQAALSHTIPDFPKILSLGASGVINEIKGKLNQEGLSDRQKGLLEGMIHSMEGMIAYSKNLSAQAAEEAAQESDPKRKAELENIAQACAQVIENPARNLDEAVNAVWITWVGMHMENTNAGLSMGRLDQWLQPYYETDLEKISDEKEREAYIKHAIELVGCLFMRCTDHLPLTPDLANWYFGGSSSDQAITLGGVTPEGEDAVNDMTYIFLKVTEMLGIRDPNVNARYNREKNSDVYLKRLCEVNLITAATPSLHSDQAVIESLKEFDYAQEDLNNWSATGCVEPTLSGRHIGHTNFQMMNMVAALEMALNNGLHPLMNWRLGPETGEPAEGAFKTFDDFFEAFTKQFAFLIDQSVEYNNLMGLAHQAIRPTPFLSSLIDDCISTAADVTHGGARYNSSGAACIGLADVTDSLMAIKKLVYDDKSVSFADLKNAVADNFQSEPALHALITHKVPLFGSGSEEAVEMANRVAKFAHDHYGTHTNYRGGKYTVGFWSMSNHVIYGTLSGALPSGKLEGKPFTPGLTPQPIASPNLLDNIRDVARLSPKYITNNLAFNVKIVPGPNDTHEQTVDNMFSYVKTYFDLGGMQMQLNAVTSDTLKDAMANPENYRNLLVRISGYNAYFVTLNRDMQLELIERAQYGL
ncbi:pyruvate formate lyase family protein [Desulfatibacillum aliphaticivorans]|uniref:pyruvate formate lyase family protein n=1 Tax=Desulfatibacillum aliphaticivorans TaxID=218208 RepID=UPI000421D365|nr:pyruvate formate lyase family protein [Desulfatibacillum aliphaticivorans]